MDCQGAGAVAAAMQRLGSPPMANSTDESSPRTSPRRGTVWPWLVMPLITLAVFFALQRCHSKIVAGSAGEERAAAETGAAIGL